MGLIHLFVVLVTTLVVASQPPNPPQPAVFAFVQQLDHFNSSDHRTFNQRYLIYDNYWNPAGPDGNGTVFFCPGGESDVFGGYEHNGFMFELGKKVNALLVFPEHRYYGQSLPFGPVGSYMPDKIGYLTVEQAMADYVAVLDVVFRVWSVTENTPVIAFGGSYPGELTAYMRVAYPQYIDAGLASSAPLNYRIGNVPGGAFYQVATQDFAVANAECPDLVRQALSEIASLAETEVGRVQLSKQLGLCTTLPQGKPALRLFNLWVENAFATLGMENYPYPLDGFPAWPMKAACEVMVQNSGDLLTALGQTVGVVYNSSSPILTCFNISNEYYPCADITGCGGGVGDPDAMSWDYQSCTEIVFNVDTNNVTDMFPPAPYDFAALKKYCLDTWNTVPNPFEIPEKYNYTTTTRLIYSNGAVDPWSPGGVLPNNCPEGVDSYCLMIADAAHHLDLRGTDPVNDPPAVTKARQLEATIITNWITKIRSEKSNKLTNE